MYCRPQSAVTFSSCLECISFVSLFALSLFFCLDLLFCFPSSFRLLKQQGFSEEELHAFQGWWAFWPNSTLQRLCVPVSERASESVLIYKLVFVRNERNIVLLCTEDPMMLAAHNTPPGSDGLYRKSEKTQCSKILLILDSFVSVWNKVNRVHENYELKLCKCV